MTEVSEGRLEDERVNRIRQEAMEFAGIGLYRYKFDGTVVFMDRGALKILELDDQFPIPSAVIGKNVSELVVYTRPSGLLRARTRKFGRVRGVEYPFKTLKENEKWAVYDSYLLRDSDTGEESVQVVMRDITERKRAQEALRESEEKYRNILESIQEGYYEVDLAGNFTFFNKALCRILGYSEDEMMGMNYRQCYGDEANIAKVYETYNRVYTTGTDIQVFDWEICKKDGARAVLAVSISLMRNADGEPIGFRGIARDVTEQKQAEKALRRAEARNRAFLNAIPDTMIRIGKDGTCLDFRVDSETSPESWARDEIVGSKLWEIVPKQVAQQTMGHVARALETGHIRAFEFQLSVATGVRHYETRLVVSGEDEILAIVRDTTERKRAEEERERLEAQIQHTQKLESLGVLTGGIAHDFNNLLVGILGNAALARGKLSVESPARAYIEKIETTARRAGDLTNQMLAYSGKGTFLVQPLDLSKLAEEMGRLLEASISKKVVVEYALTRGLPLIEGDATQLQQVIMNLVTNASDAVGDEPGVITLRTDAMDADRAYLSQMYFDDELTEGRYVFLEVADTGCGMDAQTQARIFDPFFTTKFAGRGLGLAATLGIVRGHKGAIKVYSEPGRGTTFTVLFPVAGEREKRFEQEAPAPQQDERLETWRGNGVILIADDEEDVRAVAKEVFEQHGFSVLTAADGREAVELFQAHCERITAVLLDLTMPVEGGVEAFGKLQSIRPDVPIVLSSGYTQQGVIDHFPGKGPAAFIQKPYPPTALLKIFRDLLEP